VLDCVEHLKIGETFDMDVGAKLPDRIAPGRLIAHRLSDDAVGRARERLRREKGAELSACVYESAKYVLLFTTATRKRLDAERCLQGYRLRWQIELQFKRWKSLCGFGLLPNQRDDATLAWLYTKVLPGLVLDRMASIPTEISPRSAPVASSTSRPMSCDPWKLTTILWPLLIAALLPLELHEAIARLPNLVRRLRRTKTRKRRTQRERFRRSPFMRSDDPLESC